MIQVFINNGGGTDEIELTKFVTPGSIQISKGLSVPTTCSITMTNSVGFVMPVIRSYIRIYSTKYSRTLFTGFLTADPTRTFQGIGPAAQNTNFQFYQYAFNYTSDEYLLTLKQVDFIPAFVNQTQGQILKNLANILAPGFYDTSEILPGDLVPYLQYDPSKTWADYAKQFCDASRYYYSCKDRRIRFQPYGDSTLGISYDDDAGNDRLFDPNGLSTTAYNTQIINDITVIGQQEAGDNHEDFFIGTGFNGAYPLNHKVFGLATSFQGSSVLLVDAWTSGSLNTQNWYAQDAAGQFNYTGGALNIISGFNLPYGLSYIYSNNAIELAGGLVLQHGEVLINDTCTGLIGGIYDDTTMNPNTCEAAFQLIPTQTVVVTASGATGIAIQPYRLGAVPNTAFTVLSKINKSYTLYTKVTAPLPVRYFLIYRSIAGYQFGGFTTGPTVSGSITWTCVETDSFTGFQTFYYMTMANVTLPDTAIYGVINNNRLNISLQNTQLWTPPPGSLNIQCEVGAGALAPIYISGNVQFTGAFVTPSGGHLPIQQGGNDPVAAAGFGPEQQFDMGSGIGNQAAEIDSGTLTDTLNFYSNALPGVGTRIRLQTWESQAAVSRIRDTNSVAYESTIVGDDGVRSSVISNLSPLPRTSEDCDSAAQAILKDRTGIFYQGTYNSSYLFFSNLTSDIEFYPVCGRYLYVNSPKRNIFKQNFLVTSLTISVNEMKGEIVYYSISFGPDLYLQKLLPALTQTPENTLTPTDSAISLTPQQLSRVGSYFLPDVQQSTVFGQISGTQLVISLKDKINGGSPTILGPNVSYEIRSADIGTWGQNDSTLLYRTNFDNNVTLPRTEYDQTWFIRQVSGAYISSSVDFPAIVPSGHLVVPTAMGVTGAFNANNVISSRRTKVLRVQYPLIPATPALLTADTSFVQMDVNGDTRNIEGLEIRESNDATVCYQCVVGTRFDLGINMSQLRNQLSPGESGLNGLGQYLVNPLPATARDFKAHFFNLMWEYGPALDVQMPAFNGPTIKEAFRWGPALQVNISVTNSADINRGDIESTVVQICSANTFLSGSSSTFIQVSLAGNPGLATANVPVTGDLYVRAAFVDEISQGSWSNTLHIPQGNLIASDYLSSQGSVPPVITNANGGSGSIFTYTSTTNSVNMYCQAFSILYSNGAIDQVAAVSGAYTSALDTGLPLSANLTYGFFPYLLGPTTATPTVVFDGPFQNYATTSVSAALSGMFADGAVPLVNSAFVVHTDVSGGTGGFGGGGGTWGGGSCGVMSSQIKLDDDSLIPLSDLKIGMLIKSTKGKVQRVLRTILKKMPVYEIKTKEGYVSRASLAHTLQRGEEWLCLEDILVSFGEDGEQVFLNTEKSAEDELLYIRYLNDDWIVQIELGSINDEECDHTYILDGFHTHNVMVKGSGASSL